MFDDLTIHELEVLYTKLNAGAEMNRLVHGARYTHEYSEDRGNALDVYLAMASR